MKDIRFTLAARCEAAGRENNEDNYQVVADIAGNRLGFTADEELRLGELGTLLVVCDGMGGMNAGEVASAIAVQTIKDCFAADKITKEVLSAPEKYIVSSIQAADAAIKAESKRNPATEGMGSTIVLAWLLRGKVYVGWCGDSRAYRYNAISGLERLSHDHSYVQELVDAGSITEELAFFHPNNNIITRSLGDPRGAAQPDTKVFDIQQGDIYLLCSDGLCGCLQDHQIQEVIEQHHTTISQCRDALWQADEAAGWHDNVTTVLAQITAGGVTPVKRKAETSTTDGNAMTTSKAKLIRTNRILKGVLAAIVFLVVVVIAGIVAKHCVHCNGCATSANDSTATDSTSTVQTDTISNGVDAGTPVANSDEADPESADASMGSQNETTTTSKAELDKAEKNAKNDSLKAEMRRKEQERQRNREEQEQAAKGVKVTEKVSEKNTSQVTEQEEPVPDVQTTIEKVAGDSTNKDDEQPAEEQ